MICQSAPPGRTRPRNPGPSNVPPVMGTMRRSPAAVQPISCAGPTLTRASITNSSPGAVNIEEFHYPAFYDRAFYDQAMIADESDRRWWRRAAAPFLLLLIFIGFFWKLL